MHVITIYHIILSCIWCRHWNVMRLNTWYTIHGTFALGKCFLFSKQPPTISVTEDVGGEDLRKEPSWKMWRLYSYLMYLHVTCSWWIYDFHFGCEEKCRIGPQPAHLKCLRWTSFMTCPAQMAFPWCQLFSHQPGSTITCEFKMDDFLLLAWSCLFHSVSVGLSGHSLSKMVPGDCEGHQERPMTWWALDSHDSYDSYLFYQQTRLEHVFIIFICLYAVALVAVGNTVDKLLKCWRPFLVL